MDDVLIASSSVEEHKKHLEIVFQRFNEYGIAMNLSKCCFGESKLELLGYEVSKDGIKPLDSKMQAIKDFPKPKTVEELRRFLGMLNFYRAHIPRAVEQQTILNSYLHNAKKRDKTCIVWTHEADQAFTQCKLSLQNAVTLSHPRSDVPIGIFADASGFSVGSSLQQYIEGNWRPLGFFSQKMSETQQRYSTYDRELLAIFLAIRYFKDIIEGRDLVIYTDHKPLTFAFTKTRCEKETPRRIRQLAFISEYTTDIRYVCGNDNVVADALSRVESILCPTVLDYELLADAQMKDDTLLQMIQASSDGNNNAHYKLKKVVIPTCNKNIYCEVSSQAVRPYITKDFRKLAFESVHNLSHPGVRTTRKMICSKYFWPGMNKDIGQWAKACIPCQKTKVSRHVRSEFGQFTDAGRFEHIHVDIVGPLPTSPQGFRYLVTVIDRKTRWPEVFPVQEITAEVVAQVIYDGWITRYGTPKILTSDQGRQFESNLFRKLLNLLGIRRIRSSSYHPQSNGSVERFHRSLKVALTAKLVDRSWIDELPTAMLGLRAAIRSDSGVSAAELVFGKSMRLPGDFYDVTPDRDACEPYSLVERIRETINNYRPVRKAQNTKNIFVFKDLMDCEFVFVRDDAVHKSLKPPYNGPFRVIERTPKVFLIQFPNRSARVSIDRLKPAYILKEDGLDLPSKCTEKTVDCNFSNSRSSDLESPKPVSKITRLGRVVKRPVRFADLAYT